VARSYTEADFEHLSWHDCHVWRIDLHAGDPAASDWTSDLVLDVDFIAEWLCEIDGGGQFRVAPATLAFHGVTDLRINIDWGRSGFRSTLHEVSIDRIERAPIPDQKVYLDRPYYSWTIRLNWPASGEIAFGAVGFTLTLWAEPIVIGEQRLSRRERQRLTGA
jgi:hypothetical protein